MKQRILIERIPGIFASLYEKASRMVRESYYRLLAEEIASSLKTGTILDLGTGPGFLPIEIAKAGDSISVTGLDLSPELIAMAQQNALQAGVADRVHFKIGSAAAVPFEDSSFDGVISTGMLHMVRDPVKVFQEIFRVLKAGGRGWVLDPARVSSSIDKVRWKASLDWREKLALQGFNVFRRFNPGRTYSKSQIEAMVAPIGFRDCRVVEEGKEIKISLLK